MKIKKLILTTYVYIKFVVIFSCHVKTYEALLGATVHNLGIN